MDEVFGTHKHKDAYLKRLRRIEGHVRGLQRMVDEDVKSAAIDPNGPWCVPGNHPDAAVGRVTPS